MSAVEQARVGCVCERGTSNGLAGHSDYCTGLLDSIELVGAVTPADEPVELDAYPASQFLHGEVSPAAHDAALAHTNIVQLVATGASTTLLVDMPPSLARSLAARLIVAADYSEGLR